MRKTLKSVFFDWGSPMGRVEYLASIAVVTLLKLLLDRLLLTQMDSWPLGRFYLSSLLGFTYNGSLVSDVTLTWQLAILSLPFAWVSLHFTARRLRDTGWPIWLSALAVAPIFSLAFSLVLSFVPGKKDQTMDPSRAEDGSRRLLASALFAVASAAGIGVIGTWASTEWLGSYGATLFVVIPVGLPIYACVVYGFSQRRDLSECIQVALLTSLLATLALVVFAFEGVLCLLMAAPLLALEAVAGALVGYGFQFAIHGPARKLCLSLSVPVSVLGSLFFESSHPIEPKLLVVETTAVVRNTPEKVWPSITEFGELPPPVEPLFRLGVAYPRKTTLSRPGVGAHRVCVLSTGNMDETVTVWDEPRTLRFRVDSNPASMREMSLWRIDPPHLHGFVNMVQGEFRLEPLQGGQTRLIGTSWYQMRLEPEWYWRLWSDQIVHDVHNRVFRQVKAISEPTR